ncbi:C69 family dipeptidase [Francisella halioticida]|uniref:C69 family dipeptidase n=1 Tax=Francisella halioticida TaxID=549298 RepID=UPI0021016924|nr:C69 family dipeptidase [Francisella halioticida]
MYSKDDLSDRDYNYPRVKYLQNVFTSSEKNKSYYKNSLPTFLMPEKKISITDIEKGLQSHFEGTLLNTYQFPSKIRPISVYRTKQSHILCLRKNLPISIANIKYLSLGMGALSIYMPFYYGAKIPSAYQIGDNNADDFSAYLIFRKLQMIGMLNFTEYAPIIKHGYSALNTQIKDKQIVFEKKYLEIYQIFPEKAQKLLDDFTSYAVASIFTLTKTLTNELITIESNRINTENFFSE